MKKLLSLILSLAMAITMLGAFGLTASAKTFVRDFQVWLLDKGYNNYVVIDSSEDWDTFYSDWKNSDTYDKYELLRVCCNIIIPSDSYYDFTKSDGSALTISFNDNVTIGTGATIKARSMEFSGYEMINNGTLVLTQPNDSDYALATIYYSYYDQHGLINNGTIKMMNNDKIKCSSDTAGSYPITNNGTIKAPTETINFSCLKKKTDANAECL